MTWLSEDLKRRVREEEWVRSYRDVTAELESEGRIPKGPLLLLRRQDGALTIAGGVLCGAVMGSMTAFLDFFIFNYLLHLF